MRKSFPGVMALIMVLWSAPTSAQENIFEKCVGGNNMTFKGIDYNQFRNIDKTGKNNIITWWLSGYSTGLSIKDISCAKRIGKCIDSTSASQRLAMVEKKASEAPHEWGGDHSFPAFIYQSFVVRCLKGEIPLNGL